MCYGPVQHQLPIMTQATSWQHIARYAACGGCIGANRKLLSAASHIEWELAASIGKFSFLHFPYFTNNRHYGQGYSQGHLQDRS